MLANAGSLFQTWHIPFFLAAGIIWIFGGGYLFKKTLSKFPENKRMKLSKGIVVALLTGAVGVVISGLIFVVTLKAWAKPVVSLIAAAPFFPIMAYLTAFSMFKLSAKQTLRACLLPIGSGILLLGVTGAGCGIPTIMTRRAFIKKINLAVTARNNLDKVFKVIARNPAAPPESLNELVKIEGFDPELLKSPANSSREIGYFYLKPDRVSPFGDDKQQLLACDFRDNFEQYPEKGRSVLYTNGKTEFLRQTAFRGILAKKENEAFAKALKEAEASK